MANLGFIGLGKMGRPMAQHLLNAGHRVTVHNRSRAVVNDLAAAGAIAATTPAEVGAHSDIVFTCLWNSASIEEVYFGPTGLISTARAGQLLVDHTTVTPVTSRRCADAAKERGAAFLDAPISGGPAGAQGASLTIMVGGDPETFEKAKPYFELLGKNIRLLGSIGAGSTVKLANQLLVGIHVAAVCEAFVLATKAGMDAQVMLDVLATSFGGSAMLSRCVPLILQRNFKAGTSVDLISKDLDLIDSLGSDLSVRLLLGGLAREIYREAHAVGLGEDDMAGLIRVLEQQAGVEVH